MYISIYRNTTNSLYTEGKLLINGKLQSYTVEPTDVMLPEGEYMMVIEKQSPRKQTLSIVDAKGHPTKWKVGLAHSFLDGKKKMTIAIGKPLVSGAIGKGSPVLQRLTDRITKCIEREEPVLFNIYDTLCTPQRPSPHWFAPQHHNCPPTTIHVETSADDLLRIFDGDNLIKTIEIKSIEDDSEPLS